MPRNLVRLALVAAVAGFLLLAIGYDRDPLATLDAEVSEWVAASMPGWVEALARPFSWLGGWVGMTILGVATAVVLVRERNWIDVAFLALALPGSTLVVGLLKAWFDRPRPDAGSPISLPESAAFPSGHAVSGVAGVGALAILAAERLPSRRARVWLWTAAVIVGLGIGLSRIALNVHFVTDVLAGWCFGLAWLAGCLLVRDRLRAHG